MAGKAKVKRKVKRELRIERQPEDALDVLEELKGEVEAKIEETPVGRVPGRIVDGVKTAYTYQDLVDMFPIVTFTPEDTLPLNFNGVRVQAIAGVEMHVPSVYKEIYDNHRKALRKIKPDEFDGYVLPGAGAF